MDFDLFIKIQEIQKDLYIVSPEGDAFTRELEKLIHETRAVRIFKYKKPAFNYLLDYLLIRQRVWIDIYKNHIETNQERKRQFSLMLFALV